MLLSPKAQNIADEPTMDLDEMEKPVTRASGKRQPISSRSHVRFGTESPLRRLAERWLCYRYGWDEDVYFGKKSVGALKRCSGAYQLLGKTLPVFRSRPVIQNLRIQRWGRFGNSVIQLRNAIFLAETLGARTVETVEPHPFFEGNGDERLQFRWGVGQQIPTEPTIAGRFFFLNASPDTFNRTQKARIYRDYLRSLVSPLIGTPDPRVGEGDIAFHFRAGDIFEAEPHCKYGQPPLSYYLTVAEREPRNTIWLVFEDRGNPCVDAVEQALRARNIDVKIQSGSLAEDIRVLMSVKCIAAGTGSFIPAIAQLSSRLRRQYFFDMGGWYPLRELGVDATIVQDGKGDYRQNIMTQNWVRSDEQLRMMLNYPAADFTFREIAADR